MSSCLWRGQVGAAESSALRERNREDIQGAKHKVIVEKSTSIKYHKP
ncbi:MAG: hypothetical protein AB2421_03380 [Thermotaleaceae bacterium]